MGSPSPPAAQSPTHEAHQPPNLSTLIAPCRARSSPTSRAARPRPRTLPHTCPLWTHRTTSTSHPLPAATRSATQPHIAHTRPAQERRVATDSSHFVTSSTSSKEGGHRLVSLRHFVHFVTSACRITWSAMNLLHRRMPIATALADFAMPRCPFTRGVHSRRARCALRRPATASVAGGERHEQLLVTDHLPVDHLDGVTRRQA